MKLHPAPIALWYQEAASLLGISDEQILEGAKSKVMHKQEILKVIKRLQLGQEAIDKLEARLPGPFGRG